MSREAHVPFCEGLLGKFQRSTLLVMNEDESKIVYAHAAENLSRIRQMCMNFIKLVEMKGTLKRRQLKCALNTEFRERVLFGN